MHASTFLPLTFSALRLPFSVLSASPGLSAAARGQTLVVQGNNSLCDYDSFYVV